MNTPRTKPRVRRRTDDLFLYRNKLGGTYRNGIVDPAASKLIGEIVSLWPHTEESLVSLLATLINDPMRSNARNIYWTISSQNARVKVMRALLERTFENAHQTKLVDEILDEFVMLKNKRNEYVHGLW